MSIPKGNNKKMFNKPQKREITEVTISEKLQCLQRLDKGENINELAAEFKVSRVSIQRWKKQEKQLQLNKDSGCTKRKRMRGAENEKLDEAVKIWFDDCRRIGIPVTGPFIQQKARQLNEIMNGSDKFTASEGWLSNWKRRNDVKSYAISGEKLSANKDAAEQFKMTFKEFLESNAYLPSQIFNCDETGLYFKMLPKKTLAVSKNQQVAGFKVNKERLTVMCCTNADGSFRLPLVVIGKSAKPRAIKNISEQSLPVVYTHQRSAWMNSTIFEDWFRTKFAPQVRQFLLSKKLLPKALLLVDNAACHPKNLIDGQISVMFLPPNSTSIMQPLDQGIIENLKRNYKYYFSSALFQAQENGMSLIDKVKQISIRDVIEWLAQSWNDVASSTIMKCWRQLLPKALFDQLQSNEPEQIQQLQDFIKIYVLLQCDGMITEQDIDEWLKYSDEADHPQLLDEEIVDMVSSPADENNIDMEDENWNGKNVLQENEEEQQIPQDTVSPFISADRAESYLSELIDFFDHHDVLTLEEATVLHNIRYKASCMKHSSK